MRAVRVLGVTLLCQAPLALWMSLSSGHQAAIRNCAYLPLAVAPIAAASYVIAAGMRKWTAAFWSAVILASAPLSFMLLLTSPAIARFSAIQARSHIEQRAIAGQIDLDALKTARGWGWHVYVPFEDDTVIRITDDWHANAGWTFYPQTGVWEPRDAVPISDLFTLGLFEWILIGVLVTAVAAGYLALRQLRHSG